MIMDASMLPKSKRGAFQPRGDLQNRSPEDGDVNEECGATVVKPSHSNPPLPRPGSSNSNATTKNNKAKYLTVKSSGYGRASPSVKMPTRASSSSRSSSRPKLRHGDGSLAGELSLHKPKTRMSMSSQSSLLGNDSTDAAAVAADDNYSSSKSRSRSASPAVVTKSKNEKQHRGNKRNRHFDGNHSDDDDNDDAITNNNDDADIALKKKQKQHQECFGDSGNKSSSTAFLSAAVSSNSFASSLPESSNHHYNNESNVKAYFSRNGDVDPTPVKAAKKLLSDAKKKRALEEEQLLLQHHAPLSPLIQSPVVERDTLMDSNDAVSNLVQQPSTDTTAPAAAFSMENIAFIFTDLHPNISQTQSLSDNLFSIQSGIASTSIMGLIKKTKKKSSTSSAASVVDKSTASSELRKRLDHSEEELKTLKAVCNDLLVGKDEFVSGAIGIELAIRHKIMSLQSAFGLLREEKETLTRQLDDANHTIVKMKEEMECVRRDRDLVNVKCNALQDDCDGVKSNLQTLQQNYTDSCVKLALLENKMGESKVQLDKARNQVMEAQSSVEKAVAEAKAEISKEVIVLIEKHEMLVAEVKAREKEVCRMMSVDVESVDFDNGTSFLNMVRSKVEEYKRDATTNNDAHNEVARLKMELDQSKVELCSALERAATKDKDMSELMKSISDIQRMAQDREQEVHQLRKVADDRTLEAEKKVLLLNLEKQSLEKALDEAKANLVTREKTIQELQKHLSEYKIDLAQFTSQLQLEKDLRTKSEEKEKCERDERVALSAQMLAMTREHSKYESQMRDDIEKLEKSWEEKKAAAMRESVEKDEKLKECREQITSLIAEKASLKKSLTEQKTALDASKEEEIGRLKGEITVLQERMKSEVENLQSVGIVSEERVRLLEETIRKCEVERKRMHNIIQELRGNVRVFARIRPFLPNEGNDNVSFMNPSGETTLQVVRGTQQYNFQFDRVFAPGSGQDAVFGEVSEFVQSALDGYNVCLFSYGQTGSGKTHTMQGTGSGTMRGLVPRSIEQIGLHKKKLEQEGWGFTMDVSFLEIYNENIRDLLRDTKSNESKHEIKVDSDGRRTVTNLTVKRIDPSDTVCIDSLLSLASKRRATASTNMNDVSSRSHSVFTLYLEATHLEKNKLIRGTLNMVDLAGSERLDRSNASGQTAKETMAINKSLSSLTDVFAAIGEKSNHIPFRNSKLTYLLQPCFSGDGKTVMVVNISPTEESLQESMCSLRFASWVNKCELGKAKRMCTTVR